MFWLILSILSSYSAASLTVSNYLNHEINVITEGHCNPLEELHVERVVESGKSTVYEINENNLPVCLAIRTQNHHYVSEKIEKVENCRVLVKHNADHVPTVQLNQDCLTAD